MMTLKQFRATGRNVTDLTKMTGADLDNGRVYHENTYIERGPRGGWRLPLEGSTFTGPLPKLEARLYRWLAEVSDAL